MNRLRLCVSGAGGRVGKEIVTLAGENGRIELCLGLGRNVPKEFKDSIRAPDLTKMKCCDAVIDFSSPEYMRKILRVALSAGVPFVSGTTGLSANDKKALHAAGKKIPVLWSPNMSLGIAVVKRALSSMAHFGHADFQVEELHHNRKKDNPSGTAVDLNSHLEKVVKRPLPKPVGIRGGGIFGVHKIWAMTDEEVILVEHQALNRTVFARGALMAAAWIVNQKPGLYSIDHVLDGK